MNVGDIKCELVLQNSSLSEENLQKGKKKHTLEFKYTLLEHIAKCKCLFRMGTKCPERQGLGIVPA